MSRLNISVTPDFPKKQSNAISALWGTGLMASSDGVLWWTLAVIITQIMIQKLVHKGKGCLYFLKICLLILCSSQYFLYKIGYRLGVWSSPTFAQTTFGNDLSCSLFILRDYCMILIRNCGSLVGMHGNSMANNWLDDNILVLTHLAPRCYNKSKVPSIKASF